MDTRFITSNDSISHGEATLCAVQTVCVHQGDQVDLRLWDEWLWVEQHGFPAPGHGD